MVHQLARTGHCNGSRFGLGVRHGLGDQHRRLVLSESGKDLSIDFKLLDNLKPLMKRGDQRTIN